MKRKVPSLDKPYRKQRKLAPEEAELWRGEMGDKPKLASRRGFSIPSPLEEEGQDGGRPVVRTEFVATPHPNPPPQGGRGSRELARAGNRRARHGAEATLDLHGHTQATAYTALVRFLAAAREHGLRRALVITGKGRGEESLRALLPRWLQESPLRESVIACDNAGPRDGGEGAWVVRLSK